MRRECMILGAPDVPVGTIRGGRRIESVLGRGGMATVYRAVRDAEPREVAVKVLDEELSKNREFTRRCEREARAAMLLDHPCVVRTIGYGQDAGRLFIVM